MFEIFSALGLIAIGSAAADATGKCQPANVVIDLGRGDIIRVESICEDGVTTPLKCLKYSKDHKTRVFRGVVGPDGTKSDEWEEPTCLVYEK